MTEVAPSTEPATGPSPSISTPRRVGFIVIAVLLAAVFGLLMGGVPALFAGWFDTELGGLHRMHDIGHGVFAGLLLTGGYLSLLAGTGRRVATAQQVAVALAVFAAVGVATRAFTTPEEFVLVGVLLALTGVLLGLHPQRGELVARGEGLSVPLAVLGLVGLGLFGWYAIGQMQLQLAATPGDPHFQPPEAHFAGMAALGLGLPLVALLASLRAPGWRLVAWSAGIGTTVFGLAAMLMPRHDGSVGRVWGVLAVLGGLAFAALTEREARNDPVSR